MDSEIGFVVLAAGVGSRYNGLKQLDTFGHRKLTIAEYNVLHAIEAGFRSFYFVINERFADVFYKRLKNLFPKNCRFCLIYQRPENDLLKFCNRTKPWGTGHAVLCCSDTISVNFCVTNADDLYGKDAIARVAAFLQKSNKNSNIFANVAYRIIDTLPTNKSVSRGIITSLDNKWVQTICERVDIDYQSVQDGDISKTALASMNLWGFTPMVFELLRNGWEIFKKNIKNIETEEFFLPSLINSAINNNQCKVQIIRTESVWHGITRQADKEAVEKFLQQ